MPPIAKSIPQASTSINIKNDSIQCKDAGGNDTNGCSEVDSDSNSDEPRNHGLHRQTSNLFLDECDLRKSREHSISSSLPQVNDAQQYQYQNALAPDEGLALPPSSNYQRFGSSSPSGSGGLDNVSPCSTSLSNKPQPQDILLRDTSFFGRDDDDDDDDKAQIDADEELARYLQAEENKKRQTRKPRVQGSTLECWVMEKFEQGIRSIFG